MIVTVVSGSAVPVLALRTAGDALSVMVSKAKAAGADQSAAVKISSAKYSKNRRFQEWMFISLIWSAPHLE